VDRPIGRAADRNDRAPLITCGGEGQFGFGQAQLVDTDNCTQFRPRDGPAAGDQREQIGVVAALDHERLDDAGCRDAEELRRLVEAACVRSLADLDLETTGCRGIPNPVEGICHASGAASGSSATQSSSSVRSACHAAYSTPAAAAAPRTIAM